MLSFTLNELFLYSHIEDFDAWNQPLSPRQIEDNPPKNMSAKDARIAIQGLIEKGVVVINNDLKLVIKE